LGVVLIRRGYLVLARDHITTIASPIVKFVCRAIPKLVRSNSEQEIVQVRRVDGRRNSLAFDFGLAAVHLKLTEDTVDAVNARLWEADLRFVDHERYRSVRTRVGIIEDYGSFHHFQARVGKRIGHHPQGGILVGAKINAGREQQFRPALLRAKSRSVFQAGKHCRFMYNRLIVQKNSTFEILENSRRSGNDVLGRAWLAAGEQESEREQYTPAHNCLCG
jgi:hypothetical protein